MKIRQLEALIAFVEQGNVNRAAGHLNTSQPNVTRLLMTLESDLGYALFDRSGPRLHLTPAGRALYRRAKSVSAEIAAARVELRMMAAEATEIITINSAPAPVSALLPRAIARLKRENANVKLVFEGALEDRPEGRIRTLQEGLCDLAITTLGDSEQIQGIKSRRLLDLTVKVFASKGHPALRIERPTLANLQQYDWIMPGHGGYPLSVLEKAFRNADAPLRPTTLCVANRQVIFSLLKEGMFLAAIPYNPAFFEHPLGELCEITIPELSLSWPLYLLTRSNYRASTAMERFIEIVQECASQAPGGRTPSRA